MTHRRRDNVRAATGKILEEIKGVIGGERQGKRRRPHGLNTPSRANHGTRAYCSPASRHTSRSTRRRPLGSSHLSLRTKLPTFTRTTNGDPGSGDG